MYSLLYLEYLATWFVSLFLLVLQHVKGLAEVCYCHKLYWFAAFAVQITFLVIYSQHREEIHFTLQLINFISLLILNALVCYQSLCAKTPSSIRTNRLLSDPPVRDANMKQSLRVSDRNASAVFIRVKLVRKFNQLRKGGSLVF